MKRLNALTVIALALLMLASNDASAYVRMRNDDGQPLAWSNPDIVMTFDGRVAPLNSDPNAFTQHAMWTWNQVRGSAVEFWYNVASAATPGREDGVNAIGFRSLGSGVIALTTTWYSGTRIVEADLGFGTAWTWAYGINAVCGDNAFDFATIAIHELGHVLGLDHENDLPCAMNPGNGTFDGGPSLGALRLIVPNADDARGARVIYPLNESGPLELSAGNHILDGGGPSLITVPATARTGGTIQQAFNIQNRGLGVGAATLAFYLSTDEAITDSDRLIGVAPRILAPGTSVGTANLTVPAETPPGVYHLGYALETSQAEGSKSDNATRFCNSTIRITDATAPTLAITSPRSGSTVGGGPVEVRWQSSDNDRVSRITVSVSLDGANWTQLVDGTQATGTVAWDPGVGILSSQARVRATARDPAGNQSVQTSGAFTVDRVAPTLTTYFMSDQYLFRYFDVFLFGNEELDTRPTVTLTPDGGTSTPVDMRRTRDLLRANIDLRASNPYTLSITAADRAGNQATLTRRLRAGSLGGNAASSLELGPVVVHTKPGTASTMGSVLLADAAMVGERMLTTDGRAVVPTGVAIEIVGNALDRTPLELVWRIDAGERPTAQSQPVIVHASPDGGATIVSTGGTEDGRALKGGAGANGLYFLAWSDERDAPEALTTELAPNFPNPFNPQTTIAFSLARDARVDVVVFDVAGRVVRTLASNAYTAGRHHLTWDGRNDGGIPVASGVYFYRLSTTGFVETRKMTLLK